MPSDLWWTLLVVLLLVSVLLQSPALVIVVLALAVASYLGRVWARRGLRAVACTRRLSQHRAFHGEEIEMVLEISNKQLLPLVWLETRDEIPSQLTLLTGKASPAHLPGRDYLDSVVSVGYYTRIKRHYRFRCDQRGFYSFGPLRLRTGDPFGIGSRDAMVVDDSSVLVYPRVVPLHQLGLPSAHPFGERRVRSWLLEDPMQFVGVREYVRGDSPRRIHWKASARTMQLQSKLFEPSSTPKTVLFLNLNTYGSSWWWQGYSTKLLERAITTCASLANWCLEAGLSVGLHANGHLHEAEDRLSIASSRDPDQLVRILEALATVLPFATSSLPSLLERERSGLPFGATVGIVTSYVDEEMAAAMLSLRNAGNAVTVFLVGDEVAPSVSGVRVMRVPIEDSGSGGPDARLA